MIDPTFDPLAQLEQVELRVTQLTLDKMQLVTAINHQATAIGLINKQVSALIERGRIQDEHIKLLQAQISNIGVIQTVGIK